MTDWTGTLGDFAPTYRRRPSRKLTSQIAPAAAALAFSVALSAWKLYSLPAGDPSIAAPPIADATTRSNAYGALPAQSRGSTGPAAANAGPSVYGSLPRAPKPTPGRAANPAFSVAFAWDSPAQDIPPGSKADQVPSAPSATPEPDAALPGAPARETADIVPLPIPRPPTLEPPPNRNLLRPPRQVANKAGVPAAPPDNRNFFEKLFGAQPSSPALAYASPEDGTKGNSRSIVLNPSAGQNLPAGLDRYTAIYDISAHTVYLPNGTRLEAHSGLGNRLDDPRYVSERDRGATPPNVYELEARTELFHGVQALRLNPVGDGAMFGRNGILAHTYMLGPNGDSNGCISFRDYNTFLQAFLRGEIKRVAVVARQS